MAEEDDESGEIAGQADVLQHPFADIGHLMKLKPDLVFFRARLEAGAFEAQAGEGGGLDEFSHQGTDQRGRSGKQNPSNERERSENPEGGG